MSKRPWTQIYSSDWHPSRSAPTTGGRPALPRLGDGPAGPAKDPNMLTDPSEAAHGLGSVEANLPAMSRRIKACAACRKQKVKCLIDDNGAPCRRCAKHRLECVVSRNLQTIIDDNVQYTDAIFNDLENLHTAIRTLVQHAGLPEPNVLQTAVLRKSARTVDLLQGSHRPGHARGHVDPYSASEGNQDNGILSRDSSPGTASEDEDPSLPRAPIQSLYALTKLKSLRSPGVLDQQLAPAVDDLIARGAVSEEVANRLFLQYRDGLDAFIYNIGCRYETLTETRKKSPVLTAAIFTVAALHDPESEGVYSICNAELRRLISLAMFDRQTSRDYLRAMCLVSYWLSDIWWMISGHAIRLASESDLHNQQTIAVEQQSEEAADGARLWFVLRVCDQRLATLYGRPAIVHEDNSIHEIENFLQSPVSNEQDRRLMGQVSLLNIFKGIRELFGPDKGKPTHRAYLHQIAQFNKQLDNWCNHWSGTVSETYEHIGVFPRKAVRLHCQFAKLHLNSHVFRGLSAGEPIPHYFLDCAAAAVSAATSTIEFILTDPDVAAVVVGIPSYHHCMTAFTCTFLIRVALKYGRDLLDPDHVWDLTTRLVRHFRSVPAGRWHLTKLMAPGLERMASLVDPTKATQLQELAQSGATRLDADGELNLMSRDTGSRNPFMGFNDEYLFDYSMNVGLLPVIPLDLGTSTGAEERNTMM